MNVIAISKTFLIKKFISSVPTPELQDTCYEDWSFDGGRATVARRAPVVTILVDDDYKAATTEHGTGERRQCDWSSGLVPVVSNHGSDRHPRRRRSDVALMTP
ncbi:hypothetical protein Bca4012_063394 [Brassica carinata]